MFRSLPVAVVNVPPASVSNEAAVAVPVISMPALDTENFSAAEPLNTIKLLVESAPK